MQNRPVEDFEEILTLGEYLDEDDLHNLYLHLQTSNLDKYNTLLDELRKKGRSTSRAANGEIEYKLKLGKVSYSAREMETEHTYSDVRSMWFTPNYFLNRRRLIKFFAQSEVDVIKNFPLPGVNQRTSFGFGVHSYPYYELNFYSNGRGKLKGLLNKYKIA
jgi:hypothetical protein